MCRLDYPGLFGHGEAGRGAESLVNVAMFSPVLWYKDLYDIIDQGNIQIQLDISLALLEGGGLSAIHQNLQHTINLKK